MKKIYFRFVLMFVASTLTLGFTYAQTCPSGMVSFWKFDDLSTDVFVDSYGNHDAESETDVVTEPDGKVLAAKYLSGTNVVTIADHNDFDFPANSSFTVECWIRFSDPNFGDPQVVIGKRDSQTSGAYWFIGLENATGKVTFEVQGSGDTYQEIKSAAGLSLGAWHHIVAVREESTNSNKLYVDGALSASVVYDYTGSFASNGMITIGAYPNSSGVPSYFYQGNIDETAIYNRALTQAEVTEHLLKNNNSIGYCDGFAPSIKSTPVNKAVVGQQYTYTVSATGMPTINYLLLTGPSGMTIDDGTVSWIPSTTDVNAWVEIRANNGYTPADTQKYRIYLAEEPVCPTGISVLLKLNEDAGPDYYDFYGDHNATGLVSPVPVTAGIVNGAQRFNATTKVDIPDNGEEFEWGPADNFSIEFWMKTSNTGTMVMIGRYRKAGDHPELAKWWVGTDASGFATFSLQDNNSTPKLFEISGDTPLSDGIWHHIIAVRDGSAQQNRLYVDGVKVNSVSTDYANSFRADEPTEISLGYWKRADMGDPEYHFVGDMDEVAIFDKAITDAEATAFFNLRAPVGHCAIDNYVPVITTVPEEEGTEDVAYSYTFIVEDVDQTDLITLSAPTKPTWLNFNYTAGQKTAVLSGTPLNADTGDHNIVLQVYDGTATKQQAYTLSIENVNDAPVITSTPIEDGYVGELYAYVLTATDVDNVTVTLSGVEVPDWLDFNPANGILSGTPDQEDKGQNLVILRVSDGDLSVDQTFTIDVDGPTGIEDLKAAGISLYPVPASDYLIVDFEIIDEKTNIEVLNADGNLIGTLVVNPGQDNLRIDLSGMDSGVYYLRIINSRMNNIGRFIIVK